MKKYFVLALIALNMAIINGQNFIPTGTWRYHQSYSKINFVESFNGLIYGCSDFALFTINPENNETKRLLKTDGFYQENVVSIKTNGTFLIVGYSDGTIMIIDKFNTIKILTGFKNSSALGSKAIKDIYFINQNECFISTDAGILKINCINAQITDNYTNIGPNGNVQPLIRTVIHKDTLFALSSNAIRYALYSNSSNLSDYQNWNTYLLVNKLNHMVSFNNKLYVGGDSNVYTVTKTGLKPILNNGNPILNLNPKSDKLEITRLNNFGFMNNSNVFTDYGLNLVVSAVHFERDNSIWYSNGSKNGIIKRLNNLEYVYEPAGPKSYSMFSMSKGGASLYATGGGVTNTFGNGYNTSGFFMHTNGRWINSVEPSSIDSFFDFTYCHYNPKTDKYYLLNQSYGVIEMSQNRPLRLFNTSNSTLEKFPTLPYIHSSGITFDSNSIIWVANHGAQYPLHAFNGSTWKRFSLPVNEVTQLCTDKNNRKWIITFKSGFIVYDDNNTPMLESDDLFKQFNLSNTKLLSNEVTAITVDKNNWVWIGTVNGLNVITNNTNPLDQLTVEQLTISDVDGEPAYLLGENRINDIMVDGGDRKWIATDNGVYLISPDGQEQIQNFNTTNSPLSSNRVLTLGQTTNGEVFFGTDKGIFSYQSDAAAASNSFNRIKVYPNPVPPNYSGLITIDGLAYNSTIKITDANGMLITELKSNGAKATWNGLRTNGTSCNSGVFYVFAVNADNTETSMGKFIYIK